MKDGLAGRDHRADHVHRDDVLQAGEIHLVQASRAMEGPGVIDEHADRAERSDRRVEQADHLRLVGDVAADVDRASAVPLAGRDDRSRGIGVTDVADCDVVPALCRHDRRGGTDAAATAGDQSDGSTHRPSVPPD